MPRTKKKSAGRLAKDRTHDYIDDGTHEESDDEDLPSDEAGRRKSMADYAPEGHVERRRTFDANGTLVSDESFYPDGSRR